MVANNLKDMENMGRMYNKWKWLKGKLSTNRETFSYWVELNVN